MTRLRALLAMSCLVVGAGTAALAVSPQRALAKGGATIDVYNLQGDAAPMVVAVRTGYSFVAYPQVHIPRANAFIEAGQVTALASPADPGDGADSLAGLLVPQGESGAQSGLAGGAKQAPEPFKTVLNTGANAVTLVSPYDPVLTTTYEHVQVVYPDPTRKGPQQATFGADPSVAIPGGQLAINAAAGKVFADSGVGTADAGAGGAVSIPAIGLNIGRESSHVEVHNLSDRVTSDAVSSVSDLDFNPPSIPVPSSAVPGAGGLLGAVATALALPNGPILHIGSIVTTVHTERVAGAAAATATHSVVFGGVTVLGQAASIDDGGVHLNGKPQGPAIQSVVSALNQLFSAAGAVNGAVPSSAPVIGGQVIIPEGTMTGPLVKDSKSHSNNEDHVTISGLTLSVKGTLLEPTQSEGAVLNPDPSHPPTLVPGAATYTITLASADSSAYGFSFPPGGAPTAAALTPGTASPGGAGLSSSGAGLSAGGSSLGSGGATDSGSGSAPSGTARPSVTAPGSARPAGVSIDPALLSKGGLVTFSLFAEALLLGALVACYRMPASRRIARGQRGETNLV